MQHTHAHTHDDPSDLSDSRPPAAAGGVVEIDADAFEREVLRADRPVVVDFYSSECPPCAALAPKLSDLAALYGERLRFIKIFRQQNRALAERLGVTGSPTLLFFRDGDEVGERLGGPIKRSAIRRQLDALIDPAAAAAIDARVVRRHSDCDVLVLGAGPAGLTAAIYAAQARLRTVVIDQALAGGNLGITHRVSNFPGFPEPQPGYLLAHRMYEQAINAGAELRLACELTEVDLQGKRVVIDGVETISAPHIVVATGSSPRPLGVAGEREYKGKGLSYCATCDAKYYEGKHVVVVGGGNSAMQEALFIANFAERITVVHQLAELTANQEAQQAVLSHPKFTFLFEHEPRQFIARGGQTVDAVVVEDLRDGRHQTLDCDGVFIFAGMQPNVAPFSDALARDRWGYIEADHEMRTSIAGVYAAGDVRSKQYRQMTTAVSDGSIAAMAITRACLEASR